MQKRNVPSFICGVLVTLMLVGLILPVSAASDGERVVSVFTNVKVFVNDLPLDAGALNGNPEAFIYNGTTYIPVRAVSNSLGQNVIWDGSSRSVFVGKHEGAHYSLLDVCPPYEMNYFNKLTTVNIAGSKYANALGCSSVSSWDGYDGRVAIFNLNGNYNKLSFDAGHVDGEDMRDGTYNIYLDGRLAYSINLKAEDLPKHYEIDLNGALQMKINGAENAYCFALANLEVW